MLASRAVDIV